MATAGFDRAASLRGAIHTASYYNGSFEYAFPGDLTTSPITGDHCAQDDPANTIYQPTSNTVIRLEFSFRYRTYTSVPAVANAATELESFYSTEEEAFAVDAYDKADVTQHPDFEDLDGLTGLLTHSIKQKLTLKNLGEDIQWQ